MHDMGYETGQSQAFGRPLFLPSFNFIYSGVLPVYIKWRVVCVCVCVFQIKSKVPEGTQELSEIAILSANFQSKMG